MAIRDCGWMRGTARVVLLTFSSSLVACGGGPADAPPATITTTAAAPATTTVVPTTLPPAAAAPPSTLPAQAPARLGKDELRELVGPVALYPDVVLASLLPATTFPDQLHQAAQFVGQAQEVTDVPTDRGWDGSIVGLLQFPDVVRWLDGNPAWTDQMGQAVTYQQGDVLQAIQDYRHSVDKAGNLKSNQYQTVRKAPDQDILIEPARPEVVYVPSYDPAIATQPQPAPPPGQVEQSSGVNPWLAFGGGAVVGALGAWALYSIFDDDDGNRTTVNNYYYGGGRKIRGYDNYYYARGRRPGWKDWNPTPRRYDPPPNGWQKTKPLVHTTNARNVSTSKRPLRPPVAKTGMQAPSAQQVQQQEQKRQRREAEQLRKQERQEQHQAQQEQKRERRDERQQAEQAQKQEKREQRQQREAEQQQRRQDKRQAEQAQKQQRREQHQQQEAEQQQRRQDKRQAEQAAQQQRREERQRQEAEQQQRRQERQQQEQAAQQQRREQRQEMQQQHREQRQQNGGGGGGGGGGGQKKNKKKQND